MKLKCTNCGTVGDISTDYWPKPIPDRQYDWSAYCDACLDSDSRSGSGRTEQEAIDDMVMSELAEVVP